MTDHPPLDRDRPEDRQLPGCATAAACVRAGAFWTAVLVPLALVACLAVGLQHPTARSALPVLLATDAVARVLGHDPRRD
jgi:hypothetical protein